MEDYHHDYELEGDFFEGDTIRAEARTVLALWEDLDDQDEWSAPDFVDLVIDNE